jgi:hypothetical protein
VPATGDEVVLPLNGHAFEPMTPKGWTWKDSSGQKRDWAELQKLLKLHKLWLDSGGSSGFPLSMEHCDLSGAVLYQVDLRRAAFSSADLSRAVIKDSNLSGATFLDVNLSNAEMAGSNFSSSFFRRVDLESADLVGTNLSEAILDEVELKDADLWLSDLALARYEPVSNPAVRGIAAARNLDLITYISNPDALVQLRKTFKDGGFRDQERRITYAIKRTEAKQEGRDCSAPADLWNCLEFGFNTVLFDWTCQYGLKPGRPLRIGLGVWFLCSIFYFVVIHGSTQSGLFRECAPSMTEEASQTRKPEKIRPWPITKSGPRRYVQIFWREVRLFGTAMFFSLMSAFNIGFREINFGRWLRLLTREEFDIRARGWARVVAGWQSLISVFLIALWVLTYFGNPFE